jgi:hypothetical protein
MRPKANSESASIHVLSYLQYHSLLIQKHHVNRELHPKCMYGFAGCDPETLSGREAGVLQQAFSPLAAGVGDIDSVTEHLGTRLVADTQSLITLPNTQQSPLLRGN